MRYPLRPRWKGEDAFILGGGPSLKTFDLTLLTLRRVIGCNDAYLFGVQIVDVCIFGDEEWFNLHEKRLKQFTNPVITNKDGFEDHERIYYVPRRTSGFHKDALGWNGNTGASAINLALILGAKRIFLLGFDMKLSPKRESNWHVNPLDNPTEKHYERYQDAIRANLFQIEKLWPGVSIINLNPDSAMDCFPKARWEEFF